MVHVRGEQKKPTNRLNWENQKTQPKKPNPEKKNWVYWLEYFKKKSVQFRFYKLEIKKLNRTSLVEK